MPPSQVRDGRRARRRGGTKTDDAQRLKETSASLPGLQGDEPSRDQGALDAPNVIPKHKSRNARIATGTLAMTAAPRPAGQDDGLGLATTSMLEVLHDQSWVIADKTTTKGARPLRRGQ